MKKRFLLVLALTFVFCSTLSAKRYKAAFDIKDYIDSVTSSSQITINKKSRYYEVLPESWESSDSAFILYPGAYVDFESYIPLLVKVAENGIPCFVVHMLHDLAILDHSRAGFIIRDEKYASIKKWYIGGHSLGGVEAAAYSLIGQYDIYGLVLLASYSIHNLRSSGIPVLSIYGSYDGVLRINSYEKYKKNLPDDLVEIVIGGGNHAGFAVYGEQKGDNPAKISTEEQIEMTAEYIAQFCK